MRSLARPWLTLPLTPLSWLYALAVRLRNAHYDRPRNVNRVDVPVISVGNLTVGGTGKTPVVAWLVSRLAAEGVRTAVVSRGYGGAAGKGPLLVSDGGGPRVDADVAGDEPHLLARSLPDAWVWVGSDRIAVAREAAARGAEAIVLDDGFQHRRLARDLDIVLLDAGGSAGPGRMLPAGRWREPPRSLGRADVVLATRGPSEEQLASIRRTVRRFNPEAPVLGSHHRPVGFFDREGVPVSAPRQALAFCAIGSPETFRQDLERLGVELVGFRAFRDHRPYRPSEIADLERTAREADAALVTTEKDLSRIAPLAAGIDRRRLRVLRIEVVIDDERELRCRVEKVLRGAAA